jgi:choline-glycine betaine transporter
MVFLIIALSNDVYKIINSTYSNDTWLLISDVSRCLGFSIFFVLVVYSIIKIGQEDKQKQTLKQAK